MRYFVAGHRGMVGSAIARKLTEQGHEVLVKTRQELDLLDLDAVRVALKKMKPDHVVVAAAKVGGIHANNVYPADFIFENLQIAGNLVSASHAAGIERLLFLGSSCIYPRNAQQPMTEESLLTGVLESTNEPYAIAKIAGIKLCESYNRQHGTDYRSVMPTNLYGPGDNFHPENSHVVPALIRRFHEAKRDRKPEVAIWGTGTPMREFLHVDDMAEASVFVAGLDKATYSANTKPMNSQINVGTGVDVTIRELAETLSKVIGYSGRIEFDTSKPDGTPRKLLDVSRINAMGWKARISLGDGLVETYEWFQEHVKDLRSA